MKKIDYFLHNNVFDIDDDNESILFNDIVDLHSIGIKYQDNNNINDYKSETIYNKERSVTDNSKKWKYVNCPIIIISLKILKININ